LTLARELGAGDTGFAPTLAERLGLRCYDRALLEQEAVRLDVLEIEAEKIDEHPAGILERFRPGSIQRRYFEVLGQLMTELAAGRDALGRPMTGWYQGELHLQIPYLGILSRCLLSRSAVSEPSLVLRRTNRTAYASQSDRS
jgi:hypothetical protein